MVPHFFLVGSYTQEKKMSQEGLPSEPTLPLVGPFKGRDLPAPDPLRFIETSEIAARVKNPDLWSRLLKPLTRRASAYENMRKDTAHQATTFGDLCNANLLPMPVCATPFLVAISMFNSAGASPRYLSALEVMYQLKSLWAFMKDVAYSPEKETELYKKAQQLSEVLSAELKDAETTLKRRLNLEAYAPLKGRELNKTNAVFRFTKIMERHTLYTINRIEAYIYDTLLLGADSTAAPCPIEVAHVLTANDYLPTGQDLFKIDPQGTQWTRMIKMVHKSFSMRSEMWNIHRAYYCEQNGEKPHVPVVLFDTANMEAETISALQLSAAQPGKAPLYRGWLLFKTAEEYFDLLNVEYVSGDEYAAQKSAIG